MKTHERISDHNVIYRLIAVTTAYGSNDADSLDVANMARVALPALTSQAAEIERLTKERDEARQRQQAERDKADARAAAAEQRVAQIISRLHHAFPDSETVNAIIAEASPEVKDG